MPVNLLVTQIWWARATGYAALGALLLSQAMAALARLGWISGKAHLRWRRRWGILSALLASVHLATMYQTFLGRQLLAAARETPWIQLGLSSWGLLLLLWLTSYAPLVRLLRVRYWTHLHRLAYLASLLAVLHGLLAPWSDPLLSLAGLVLLLALWSLRIRLSLPILKR